MPDRKQQWCDECDNIVNWTWEHCPICGTHTDHMRSVWAEWCSDCNEYYQLDTKHTCQSLTPKQRWDAQQQAKARADRKRQLAAWRRQLEELPARIAELEMLVAADESVERGE